MPRNGSGDFSLYTPGNPVVDGTTIDPDVHNNTLEDIAQALTESLAVDGQTVPTANLPMGGAKHTGAGAATASGQYLVYAQDSADLGNNNNFGSTTFDGIVSMSANPINEADRVDVASVAGTTNIDTAAANYIRITGTNAITGFTLGNGNRRRVVAGGAFTVTTGASLLMDGVASGVVVPFADGDTFDVYGEASSVVRVSNVSRYSAKRYVLAQSSVATAAPADTNENILATISLAANAMGPNGTVRTLVVFTCTNNANAKTIRMRLSGIGGTIFHSQDIASSAGVLFHRIIANRNATNSQVSYLDLAAASPSLTTGAIDTTAATTLVITVQKATSGDTVTLESYQSELLK